MKKRIDIGERCLYGTAEVEITAYSVIFSLYNYKTDEIKYQKEIFTTMDLFMTMTEYMDSYFFDQFKDFLKKNNAPLIKNSMW